MWCVSSPWVMMLATTVAEVTLHIRNLFVNDHVPQSFLRFAATGSTPCVCALPVRYWRCKQVTQAQGLSQAARALST